MNRKPSESVEDDEEDDMEMEEVDSDEWDEDDGEPVPNHEGIFCSHSSRDLEHNVIHMTERHSFFLPDAEYLTDLEGMMAYLGEKVRLWLSGVCTL